MMYSKVDGLPLPFLALLTPALLGVLHDESRAVFWELHRLLTCALIEHCIQDLTVLPGGK